MRFIFIFIVFGALLNINSTFAQSTSNIPLSSDLLIDYAPKGFTHKFEAMNRNQLIIEFLPENETLDNWSQILSIIGYRINTQLTPYINELFKRMEPACKTLDKEILELGSNEYIYEVNCIVRNNQNIEGGKNIKWEHGIYRFLKTKEMIYQIHFVTHGTKKPSRKYTTKYLKQARKATSDVLICILNSGKPCKNLDKYSSVKKNEYAPLLGMPPCIKSEDIQCSPSAIFSATSSKTANKSKTLKKKTALYIIDFSKTDILNVGEFKKHTSKIIQTLMNGSPAFTILFRGKSPDSHITNKERMKVATFITTLRMILVRGKFIDPNTTNITYLNFIS